MKNQILQNDYYCCTEETSPLQEKSLSFGMEPMGVLSSHKVLLLDDRPGSGSVQAWSTIDMERTLFFI